MRYLTSLSIRRVCVLALWLVASLSLISCGGGGDSGGSDGNPNIPTPPVVFSVGGTVTGLNGQLQLSLSAGNQTQSLTISANGIFTFANSIESGDSFTVTIDSVPDAQSCEISGGSGVVSTDITNIVVTCDDNPEPADFSIGGTVEGLVGSVALLLSFDNTTELITVSANGRFTFTQRVPSGTGYSVLVQLQPATQGCVVTAGSGEVGTADIDNIVVTCSTASAELSGAISVVPNLQFDSDLNDPTTALVDNSTAATAQGITNRTTLQGFVTLEATDNPFDRFRLTPDPDDVFRVALQANQTIRLQVVDFDAFQTNSTFSGDLDLLLFDSALDLVGQSLSTTEFEEITVPEDGEYLILVTAFSGASRYVLAIADTPAAGASASVASASAPAKPADFIPNQAIVQLSGDSVSLQSTMNTVNMTMSHRDPSRPALASFNSTSVASVKAHQSSPMMRDIASQNPAAYEKVSTLRMIKQMNAMPGVELAEPNYIRYTQRIPNDQFYNLQWHYPSINLPQAWDITTGAPAEGQVIVAVVDTGVFLDHPELSTKLVAGYDFISNPETSLDGDGIDPNPDDPGDGVTPGSSSWHGTHVSGTIGADSDNQTGGAGVSWEARIMPMRALGQSGQGSSFDILQAVLFAAGLPNDSGTVPAQRADVINLSLGGPGSSTFEQQMYQQVADAGVIVVAAAGNESTSTPSFPASYDGVFSVSALDAQAQLASYSNFGDTIDLAAPGGMLSVDVTGEGQPDGVLSTLVDDASGERRPTLAFYQGTSMASPHVAGMFALMKAVYPPLTPDDIESLLQAGALTQDLGAPGFDTSFGYGGADALRAVQAAQALANGGSPPPLAPAILASASTLNIGGGNSAIVSLSNAGGGSPSLLSASTDEPWLTLSAETTDASGLGDYRLSIDRSGLEDGFYTATASFEFELDIVVSLQVSMTVGDLDSDGVVAELFVLLVDVASGQIVRQVNVTPIAGAPVPYAFSNVPEGEYFIFAGTDIDNDLLICQPAEACGAFPSINDLLQITVDANSQTSLDFVTDIINGFASFSASSVNPTSPASAESGISLRRQSVSDSNQKSLSPVIAP